MHHFPALHKIPMRFLDEFVVVTGQSDMQMLSAKALKYRSFCSGCVIHFCVYAVYLGLALKSGLTDDYLFGRQNEDILTKGKYRDRSFPYAEIRMLPPSSTTCYFTETPTHLSLTSTCWLSAKCLEVSTFHKAQQAVFMLAGTAETLHSCDSGVRCMLSPRFLFLTPATDPQFAQSRLS